MPDGATPVETTDVLVAAVQKRISRLADGNPLPLGRFRFQGSRTDRVVRLGMRVPLSAPPTEKEHAGAINPDGSTLCKDAASVDACLKAAAAKVVGQPATLKRVQDMLSGDPPGAFATFGDEVRIGVGAGRCHVHCSCPNCTGRGKLSCGNCRQTGQVQCGCRDGKLPCLNCHMGQVSYLEYRDNVGVTKYKTCGRCNGTGRGLNCPACRGSGFLWCNPCAGSGWVGCQRCAASGRLTVTTVAELVAKPARTLRNGGELPKEFVNALQAMNFRELPKKHGSVERHTVEPESGAAAVQLECRLSDIRVGAELTAVETRDFCFLTRSWSFVAVGKTAYIPKMPCFLDDLSAPLFDSIEDASAFRLAEKAIGLAKGSRLTASVLKAVATKSGDDDVAIVRQWEHAVSEWFVARLRQVLDQAYDGLGRGAVRRCWLLLGLPTLAAAVLAYPFRFGRLALDAFPAVPGPDAGLLEFAASGALGLLPVLAVGLLARWASTRVARREVGADARRAPRQGLWLRVPVGAAMAALIAGYTWSMPLAGAPALRPSATTHWVASGGTPLPTATGKPTSSSLSPSPLPALAAVWPPTSFRGDPQVYVAQFCLAQLGFLAQQPNGRMDLATRNAVDRLVYYLPRRRRRPASNAETALLASTALRGTFRLERTPADEFLTSGLSNLARANLTGLDVEAIKAGAFQAIGDPGVEFGWSSRDGARGGRVLATALPGGCSEIDVEVRVRGAVERTGPTRACWSHGSLVRKDFK